MTEAFRQNRVATAKAAVFGYSFGDVVVLEECLQFGWTNPRGNFCLLTSALEHSHLQTSPSIVVLTDAGHAATRHIDVSVPHDSPPPPGVSLGLPYSTRDGKGDAR